MAALPDNFILDNYALGNFFNEFGIEQSAFDQNVWAVIKTEELGIVDMPYEINYVYELLQQVGVDTDTLPSEAIYAFLGELDDSFVLDEYALYQFLDEFQIDYSEFD